MPSRRLAHRSHAGPDRPASETTRGSTVSRRAASMVQPPAAAHGQRERAASPWLGDAVPQSATFEQYQALERSLTALAAPPGAGAIAPGGISPATTIGAFFDWAAHLAGSPAKQWELAQFAVEQWQRAMSVAASGAAPECCVEPLPQDKRFADPRWRRMPHAWLAQSFLLAQQWWQRATTGVPGVSRHHEQMVEFAARQWLDMAAPSNSVLANPVTLERTLREGGANLLRGAVHAAEDLQREAFDLPPAGADAYQAGVNLACTPGRVVLRNRLIELVQYAPTTPDVHAEPVLLVPAWIMKYYILDLAPGQSLVEYLVGRGFTVFAISWKNPDAGDRDLGLDDYHRLGIRAALDAIGKIVPGAAVHAAGYCLGGTLLAMATAVLGREDAKTLKTMTLLAAQTDFAEPGEISLFIDESQVAFLDNLMARRGTLDKRQMKASFQMLRSRDLIWSYRLLNYLLGERTPVTELMAWNADGTRLPHRMHSEYLRGLYLDNDLARGEFALGGVPINLHDIRIPSFVLGAVQDHVAPWRSVWKLNHLCDADQTYVLTAGGHNAGIVNPPGRTPTSHRMREWRGGDRVLSADEWLDSTPAVEGSWWIPWADWLARHSSSQRTTPPDFGAPAAGLPPLAAAPGSYVLQR